MSAFHDVSQLESAYGKSAQTIHNASRCRIVLPGSFDEKTLKLISEVAGEALVERKSTSKSDEPRAHRSVSKAKQQTKLASRGQVRELRKGSALVFYGNLPPVPVKLLPYYEDPAALARSRGELPEVSVPEQGHEVAPEPAP